MLMKEVESAFFTTMMGISGRNPAGISKFITPHENRRAEGLSFFENGGVTYVTDCGVIEHLPDLGHWGLDFDLLFKGLRN